MHRHRLLLTSAIKTLYGGQCASRWRSLTTGSLNDVIYKEPPPSIEISFATSGSVGGVGSGSSAASNVVRSRFDALWLWYNSPHHLHAHSGQRVVSMMSPPHIVKSSQKHDAVSLVWSDGSVSEFSLRWLHENRYTDELLRESIKKTSVPCLSSFVRESHVRAKTDPPRYIERASIPTFSYDDLMGTGASAAASSLSGEKVHGWLSALNEWGVTLVENVPFGKSAGSSSSSSSSTSGDGQGSPPPPLPEPEVSKLARLIAPPMRTIYGETWTVEVMAKPINIAYAPVSLDLHCDLVYYESPPGLQLLHCLVFDEKMLGGESTLLDGMFAAAEFQKREPEHFRTLLRTNATFQKIHYDRQVPVHIVRRRPHITVAEPFKQAAAAAAASSPLTSATAAAELAAAAAPAEITGIYWAPPFEGPLSIPPADVPLYYAAYTAFVRHLRNLEDEGHMIQFRLKPGDALVFNNRRMLHGRRQFQAAKGQEQNAHRILQGCYVNIDEFKSRLNHLHATQLGGLGGSGAAGAQNNYGKRRTGDGEILE